MIEVAAERARSVPIEWVEAGVGFVRRTFFTVSRGESVNIVVEGDHGHLDGGEWWRSPIYHDVLGPAGFAGPWERSYHYEGEDMNLVRFWYDPGDPMDLPHRQDHARLFFDEYPPGKVGIAFHTEASSLAHKEEHRHDVTFRSDTTRMERVLDGTGVRYSLV